MSIAQAILAHYRLPPIERVEYLGGAGGFSGAQLWKVHSQQTGDENYCLRRWPLHHPDPDRLEWINLVLVHVASNGCPEIAVPREAISGQRYIAQEGFLWEVARWMPGSADFSSDPNDERLSNVANCLARFHLGSAQVNLDFRNSPNAKSRYDALTSAGELIEAIEKTGEQSSMPSASIPCINFLRELVSRLGTNTANKLAAGLEPFIGEVFPVQPVIRDIWHDHILFTGNEVTGIVDFGAMQMDNVALDLARVLGSIVGDQSHRWSTALDVYSQTRPLQQREIEFAFALDQSASFLGSLNWLKWILIQQRSFEVTADVEKRVSHLIDRLSDDLN